MQEVEMVSNLPHLAVRLQPGNTKRSQREALLLVDLGASGSEIIFHSRAVEELGLQDLPQARQTQLKVISGNSVLTCCASGMSSGSLNV